MRIKVSQLKSRLQHSQDFDKEITTFVTSIEDKLNEELHFAELSDYDCDLKLIFVQTGGSEGLFLKNIDQMQEPYYLLTNGSNNSLAASMEILTYLRQHGKQGEILHGSVDYIANRIKTLATVSKVKKQLKNTRLGIIGAPSDWLIASVPVYAQVKQSLGITLVDVPLNEVENAVNTIKLDSINTDDYPAYNDTELRKAIAVKKAIDKLVEKYNLDGFTIRCFDLLTSLKSTGCLALAEFNKAGITATCEGDVATMISMHILKLLTGQSSFQSNPSRINVENNNIVFAHCTIPLDMVDSYKFDTHFESGIGVAIKGEVRQVKATIFRLSADLKHYFACNGEIVENLNESNLCRTQLIIKPNMPVTEMLKNPCGNHHVIAYGEFADELSQLMNELLG